MRKKIILIPIVIVILLGAYWAKCQLGVNLIRGFAWEEHFSFLKRLQRTEYYSSPKPGVLLSATFDEFWPFQPWGKFWAREQWKVKAALVRDQVRGSKCLQVRSSSPYDWSLQHNVAFEGEAGDEFAFEGYVRTTELAKAQMSVMTYDAERQPIKWLFALENVQSPTWVKVSRSFIVPAGVRYVRFRLTGAGVGTAYIDDVKFMKIK